MEAVTPGNIWHPGQSATLRLGPKAVLAEFGALHPALTRAFDVDGSVMAVHIFLDALPPKRASGPARAAFAPPALQSVRRDRSEEHTSELQTLIRLALPVMCLITKKKHEYT